MTAKISFRLMRVDDIPFYKECASKEHVRSLWFCEGYEPVEAIYSKLRGDGNSYDYPSPL